MNFGARSRQLGANRTRESVPQLPVGHRVGNSLRPKPLRQNAAEMCQETPARLDPIPNLIESLHVSGQLRVGGGNLRFGAMPAPALAKLVADDSHGLRRRPPGP